MATHTRHTRGRENHTDGGRLHGGRSGSWLDGPLRRVRVATALVLCSAVLVLSGGGGGPVAGGWLAGGPALAAAGGGGGRGGRGAAKEETVRLGAIAEKDSVTVGETFVYQIQVIAPEAPERVTLRNVLGAEVRAEEPSRSVRESIQVVNGRYARVRTVTYVLNYRITPTQPGTLTIPGQVVRVAGQVHSTNPVTVAVTPPKVTEDMRLDLEIPERESWYVGEPIPVTVTWAFAVRRPRNLTMDLPLFDDPRVEVRDREGEPALVLDGAKVPVEQGRKRIDGRIFETLTMKRTVVPREAGVYAIEPSRVSVEAMTGTRQSRRGLGGGMPRELERMTQQMRAMMDDPFFGGSSPFDEPFFSGRVPVYEVVTAASQPLTFTVKPLPTEGRPALFDGLVGRYSLVAEATPTTASVGEPITLTVRVAGPEDLSDVRLPPLSAMPGFEEAFKIPADRGPGEVKDRSKIFTQTLRALDDGVVEIPPVELPYFDTQTGRYEVARSLPIPLRVSAAKRLTAADLQGVSTPVRPEPTPAPEAERALGESGLPPRPSLSALLRRRWRDPVAWALTPLGLLLLLGPPLLYLGVVAYRRVAAHRDATADLRAAAGAAGVLRRDLTPLSPSDDADAGLPAEAVYQAARRYFGARLRRDPATLTAADLPGALAEHGVSGATRAAAEAVFARCEGARFGGGASLPVAVRDELLAVAARIEKEWS